METETPQAAQHANPSAKATGGGLIATGYVLAFVSLIFLPLPIGIAAFVVGIVNLTRGHAGHGITQIILSVLFAIIGTMVGAAVGSSVGR